MQTEVFDNVRSAVAWLVCHDTEVRLPQRIPVTTLPFTMGRSGSTDLQINSTWVSREHATIMKVGPQIRARDLGSTNGTYLNGAPIQDAPLADGDVLRIGKTDFIFCTDSTSANRRAATQVIDSQSQETISLTLPELVSRSRRWHEINLHQGFRLSFRQVTDLTSQSVRALQFAVQAAQFESAQSGWRGMPLETPCQQVWRFRLLARLAAVERSNHQSAVSRVFLRIDPSELDPWDALANQLMLLRSADLSAPKLVLELPAQAHYEPSLRAGIRNLAHEFDFELGYGGFSGFPAQLSELSNLGLNFVTIRKGMFQATTDASEKRIKCVLTACHDMGAQAIVDGTGTEQERNYWKHLGLMLAMYD